MMESLIEVTDQGDFWNDQQDWEIVTWRLYEACGVCILEFKDGTIIHMLVERKYPLSKELLVLNSPCFMVKSWLVQDQKVLGKDYSNQLIADSLLKTIWFINAPCYGNEALASLKENGVWIAKDVKETLRSDQDLSECLNTSFMKFKESTSKKHEVKQVQQSCLGEDCWELYIPGLVPLVIYLVPLVILHESQNSIAIIFDDTSDTSLSCETTVTPLENNEIDFNISFDESDDEDYIVVFDENSFSCKIFFVDNLETDSEDENDKVNMPSSLSPEPTFGYIDDLDFFKDFENEFPAIAYNDLKSKSDPLIEPSVSSRHIDKFETSLSEYDEKEQNVLYLNDSFPLNVIFPDNLKTIKDNDDSIDLKPLSGNNKINIDAKRSNELPRTNHDKTNKFFNEKFFIITLDANIVSWNYFND
ncbi:hypothetical protein Tco_0807437 [Tanacetum coccineum]